MSVFIFRRSTKRRNFPFWFPFCEYWTSVFAEGSSVVMIPYLCGRASSTRMLSLRLSGAGGLWLLAGLLPNGVICTLNSVLIPLSKRCLAKMSWNSTSRSSTACLASSCKVESVQSKLDWNWFRDSVSFSGFNCFKCSSSRTSLRIRVWMGVCSLSLPGFCGVENQ